MIHLTHKHIHVCTHTHTHTLHHLLACYMYVHACMYMCTCTCSFKFEHTYCRCVNWCDISGSACVNQIPTHYPLLSTHSACTKIFSIYARDNTYRYYYAMYIVIVAIIATHKAKSIKSCGIIMLTINIG